MKIRTQYFKDRWQRLRKDPVVVERKKKAARDWWRLKHWGSTEKKLSPLSPPLSTESSDTGDSEAK